ncbi:histidine-rich glycoprotein-like [Vespula squamosa]|uniref:Histidine-rich glycoprotein-like n=1 Tax=Vespula squamosa TaxID=30214 RepID=A0ABD2BGN6_VESSQ
MKHFLYIVAIAMCEAARIPRQLENEHFPNFQAIYHGHGATSYQNVHVDNYGNVPLSSDYAGKVSDLIGHHGTNNVPILEHTNELGHVGESTAEVATFIGILSPSYHSLETEDHSYYDEHYENHYDDHGHYV